LNFSSNAAEEAGIREQGGGAETGRRATPQTGTGHSCIRNKILIYK